MDCSRRRLVLGTMIAALPFLASSVTGFGQDYSPRQYYGPWQQNPGSTSYYRDYYYKPKPSYAGYKHHYVVLYPSHADRCYFYNPYKKTYWGYCPSAYSDGEPAYSHLPAEYQKGSLSEIPESAFPALGALPPIPESRDGARLDLPPDDLPPGFTAPQKGGASAEKPTSGPAPATTPPSS